jgi:membrane-associated phospholipid phosphatase
VKRTTAREHEPASPQGNGGRTVTEPGSSPQATPPRGARAPSEKEPIDTGVASRRALLRLLAVCLAGVIVTAFAYAVTVGTELGQLMGELMLGGRTGTPAAVRAAEDVLRTTSRAAIAACGVSVVALALLQRREALALVAGATVVLANLTTQILKGAVLDRSDLLDNLFYVLPNSFPSGHVTAAASVAVALLLVLPPMLRNPTVILASIAVALVGASTLLAGWHRMADAIGGVFVATAWGAGLTALLVWRRGVEPVGRRTAALGRASAQVSAVVGVVVLLVGSAAYLLALADPLGVLLYLAERGGSPALLVVGVLITTGASFLALGGFGLAIRDVRLDPRRSEIAPPMPEPGTGRAEP